MASIPINHVFGYIASEADVAVLLAFRDKHLNLMVRWDLAIDKFEVGQWLARQIDPDRCALSPDGRLLGYYAMNNEKRPSGGPHPGHYIVVCRPPFFTALALWWTGGKSTDRVRWKDLREFSVGKPVGTPPDIGHLPDPYRLKDAGPAGMVQDANPLRWDCLESDEASANLQMSWPKMLRVKELGYIQWSGSDHRGRILTARGGRIFVRDPNGEREVFDLNLFKFQTLATPDWARQWPT